MTALSSAAAPEQRKAAIALNRLGVNLGMSIGPAVGGFLALVSFPLLFVVDGLTSLAAAGVLSLLLRPEDVRLVAHASRPRRRTNWRCGRPAVGPSTLSSRASGATARR